ncbi:GNAT family acetyltransferase [Herbaspirillum hiltneri N3]|uniref:GNAT family acetyltransferase n=1 Tax=Herbaspirillum hiltneri N3 TaxID=1262470 RepID=A0ABM5V1X3_9BURK|nr:GNAT family N-acetyltransferase [Herbaspirillum hiltneri]AKZ63554.1 GNAT family acetyltransferase [Herbaspirillum hiltneri N3]
MEIRDIRSDDVNLICRHREAMFREAGRDENSLSAMTPNFRNWLEPRIIDGSYFGFLATDNNTVVAGIGMMAIDWPPHPSHPHQDKRGYILNVYVEPAYRRRGIAGRLMEMADVEFKKRGLTYAILHSTKTGRPLYEKIGWSSTTEMAKPLP